MSEMLNNPPEMERLLSKYKGGRIPPLVSSNDKGNYGLVNNELLEFFQKGFSAVRAIPICVSVISENCTVLSSGTKHESNLADENSPYQKYNDMLSRCIYLRAFRKKADSQDSLSNTQNRKCCNCCHVELDLSHQDRKARVYLCSMGMLGVVVPVYVADEVVAILTTGCRKPKEGAVWPREIINENGIQLPALATSQSSEKIDLWQETQHRVLEMEKVLGIEPGRLLSEIVKNSEEIGSELSPEDIAGTKEIMESGGNHLSDLANKFYKLEKESVMGWIRAEIASALSLTDTFWEKIQWCFGNLAQLLDVDYILLISHDRANGNPLHLHCQFGLPQDSLSAIQYDWSGSAAQVNALFGELYNTQGVQTIDLRQYRDLPILGMIYSAYGKGVDYPVIVVPTTTIYSGLNCMILGKKEPYVNNSEKAEIPAKWLREDDLQYLATIARELAIIKNVFFSMKKLHETVTEQTNFMESLSHDLRTPIQNIIMAAENLREGRIPAERASRTISGLITQLSRLDLLAQKAWMLEQIRLDKLIYNDNQSVDYYKILEECRELMTDMAERESIEIYIDSDVKTWQDIRVDAEMLRQVALNLIHNGIKYSFPNTCVRLGGWQDRAGIGVAMTFRNEGIHISDAEKDLIFQRYFRSNSAIKMNPSGSGIGLALVKEFVDHYDGRISVTSTEVEFGRYLNVFSIFLPGR